MFDEDGNAHVNVRTLDAMKELGGSFAARLAGLYHCADQTNRNRLVRAFLDVFQAMEELSDRMRPKT